MSIDSLKQDNEMMEDDLLMAPGMLKVTDHFPTFSGTAVKGGALQSKVLEDGSVHIDASDFMHVQSSDYAGKWLIIFGYPKDFTPVCNSEILEFNRMNQDFLDRDAQILAFSVDTDTAHIGWRMVDPNIRDLKFPLFSDVKHVISEPCGVIDPKVGVAQRALFIVDPENVVQFAMMTHLNVARNPTEVLRILDALQTGGRCACGWQPGDENI